MSSNRGGEGADLLVEALPAMPSFRLDGKRALITGGSRGIGLACATALAGAGAEVLIAARQRRQIEHVVNLLNKAGHTASGSSIDVTDVDQLRQLISDSGPFDVAVISAGMARHSTALTTTEEDYDTVMDLNVKAAYFTAVEAARGMKGRGGSIIQLSSQMGLVGGYRRSVYCASKHAIEGMTKAMAIEWAPEGIRINSLCPTFIQTEFTKRTLSDPERLARITSMIKLGRVGRTEDVMGAVVFLASDAASLITGTHIVIDGGWTAE